MFLADTLSRAYLSEVNPCEVAQEHETVDHRSSLLVTDERWQQLQFASANDPVLQQLRKVIQRGFKRQIRSARICEAILLFARRTNSSRFVGLQRSSAGRAGSANNCLVWHIQHTSASMDAFDVYVTRFAAHAWQ